MKKAKKLRRAKALKKEPKLKGAEAFGVKIKIDKSMDKYSGKILFPKKHKMAEEMLSKLKGAEAFGIKIETNPSLDKLSDKRPLPEKYKKLEGVKIIDGVVNRDEALRSAGFTEDLIKYLHEFEKTAQEIDYDADFDDIYPDIC